MKEKFKVWLWLFIDAIMPKVINERIEHRVHQATVLSTMRVMDAQRLSHCKWCTQRFSLETVNKDAPKAERILAFPKHIQIYGRATSGSA